METTKPEIIKATFRLPSTIAGTIKKRAKQYNMSQADYITFLVEHYEKNDYLHNLEELNLKTHKSVLYIDKNVQYLLEMINMMCFNLNCNSIITDDKIKTEPYVAAKKMVNERIRKVVNNRSENLY